MVTEQDLSGIFRIKKAWLIYYSWRVFFFEVLSIWSFIHVWLSNLLVLVAESKRFLINNIGNIFRICGELLPFSWILKAICFVEHYGIFWNIGKIVFIFKSQYTYYSLNTFWSYLLRPPPAPVGPSFSNESNGNRRTTGQRWWQWTTLVIKWTDLFFLAGKGPATQMNLVMDAIQWLSPMVLLYSHCQNS